MTKKEIIEYLYGNNVRSDLTIEQMADDLDRPQGEWIDVTDELPKQGQDVLAWVETKDDARIACCNYSNSVWFDAIMDVIVSPIAWMPLPMPYHKDERSSR